MNPPKQPLLPESTPAAFMPSFDPYFDNSSFVDMDQFAKTLTNIKSENVRPDLLASIITHYASKWLPELSSDSSSGSSSVSSPMSTVTAWLKKRVFIEKLVNILPAKKDSMPCEFLLRLLRAASMVRAGQAYLEDLESRVAYQLDRASLKEVMIPAFSHTCDTLLDVGLMLRLVGRFLAREEAARSGAAMVKVAKLVDSYLAEVALDARLTVVVFEQLATAMPAHARAADDGLYLAIVTYIKAHPNTTKKEKKVLSRLIDPRKLSPEAAVHAIHNDGLPIRLVIKVLFSEQSRFSRITEWSSAPFRGPQSLALEAPGQCPSKREVLAQQHETRKLREDVGRLQSQCRALQAQIDRLGGTEKKKKKGMFRWRSFLFRDGESTDQSVVDDCEVRHEHRTPQTPIDGKKARLVHGKGTPHKW